MSFKVTETREVEYNCLKDIAEHHDIDISLVDNKARLLKKIENHLNNYSDRWIDYKIEEVDLS